MVKDFITFKRKTYYVEDGKLDLSEMEIVDIYEIKGLEHLTSLQILDLNNNQIVEIKGLDRLTNLQELLLNGNWIEEIEGLENLTNLEKLDLRWNRIEKIKGMETLTNLRELDLSHNYIEEIRGLENLTNLREIGLWDSNEMLRRDEFDIIFEITGPNDDDVVIRDAQEIVKYCKEKTKMAFVKVRGRNYYVKDGTLDLSNNEITDITEIEGLEHLSNLKALNLSWNQI